MIERESEAHLVDACRQGDRDAFRSLFEIYSDRVYSIAMHFSRSESVAHDITQQVFLKLFNRIRQYRGDAEFTTWLYRMVANACMDEHRRQKRFVQLSSSTSEQADRRSSPEHAYLRREVEDTVSAAIAELKPRYRLPILLRYTESLSYQEIAEILGCSKGTVASRLNRGHKALAQKLSHLRAGRDAE